MKSTHFVFLAVAATLSLVWLVPGRYRSFAQSKPISRASVALFSAGASVNEAQAFNKIYVDSGNPAASDSGTGAADAPLKTIGAAAAIAVENNANGAASQVLIAPGIYRERLDMIANGRETNAPIVLQANGSGAVVVSGADSWTGWVAAGDGSYTHGWPYEWGLAPYPAGWQGNVTLSDIVRRREMVFVNGASMEQELDRSSLAGGTFFVDEPAGIIYLRPPEGTDMNTADVEVSTRSNLLNVSGKKNIVIRGLTFEYETSFVQQGGPLQIVNSSNILVDACQFLWNSTGGPLLSGSDHITVQNTVSSNNGFSGMAAYKLTYGWIHNVVTSMNNWRGARGQFTYWDTAGIKLLLAHHDVIQNHIADGNQAPGLWLDTDNSNVTIEGGKWTNNLQDGVFIEASEGPASLTGSCSANNGGSGLLLADSANVDIENNSFAGNHNAQIAVSGVAGGRWVQNFEDGTTYSNLVSANATLRYNSIAGSSAAQSVFLSFLGESDWNSFASSLIADRNAWFNPASTLIFLVGSRPLDLGGWRGLTGQDSNSIFGAVLLPNPLKHLPGTPAASVTCSQ